MPDLPQKRPLDYFQGKNAAYYENAGILFNANSLHTAADPYRAKYGNPEPADIVDALASLRPDQRPVPVGHRGLHVLPPSEDPALNVAIMPLSHIPENSYEAWLTAHGIKQPSNADADALATLTVPVTEWDVRLSEDGVPFMFHDATIGRGTDYGESIGKGNNFDPYSPWDQKGKDPQAELNPPVDKIPWETLKNVRQLDPNDPTKKLSNLMSLEDLLTLEAHAGAGHVIFLDCKTDASLKAAYEVAMKVQGKLGKPVLDFLIFKAPARLLADAQAYDAVFSKPEIGNRPVIHPTITPWSVAPKGQEIGMQWPAAELIKIAKRNLETPDSCVVSVELNSIQPPHTEPIEGVNLAYFSDGARLNATAVIQAAAAHPETAKLLEGLDRKQLETALEDIVISNFMMRAEVPERGPMAFFRENGYAHHSPQDWMRPDIESQDLRTSMGFVNKTTSIITDDLPMDPVYTEALESFNKAIISGGHTNAHSLTTRCNPQHLGTGYAKLDTTAGDVTVRAALGFMTAVAAAATVGMADHFLNRGRIRKFAQRRLGHSGRSRSGYQSVAAPEGHELNTLSSNTASTSALGGVAQIEAALGRAQLTQRSLTEGQSFGVKIGGMGRR
jgi:hypothetical protein